MGTLALLCGCQDGVPRTTTDEPCAVTEDEWRWTVPQPPELDVLFVIDDSASMADEQAAGDGGGGYDAGPVASPSASFLDPSCVPADLSVDGSGFTSCELVEIQPAGTTCDQLPGREPLRREPLDPVTGRAQCRVEQLPSVSSPDASVPTGNGWFYDPTPLCDELRFTDGAEPRPGASLRLRCLEVIAGCEPPAGDGGTDA